MGDPGATEMERRELRGRGLVAAVREKERTVSSNLKAPGHWSLLSCRLQWKRADGLFRLQCDDAAGPQREGGDVAVSRGYLWESVECASRGAPGAGVVG